VVREAPMIMLVFNPFILSLRRKKSTIITTMILNLLVWKYLNLFTPGIIEKGFMVPFMI